MELRWIRANIELEKHGVLTLVEIEGYTVLL